MVKIKCKKCGDILHADGSVPYTECKCGKTFVDGLHVKGMFRYGGYGVIMEGKKPKKK